jgi:hypothetical protein
MSQSTNCRHPSVLLCRATCVPWQISQTTRKEKCKCLVQVGVYVIAAAGGGGEPDICLPPPIRDFCKNSRLEEEGNIKGKGKVVPVLN